MRRIKVGLFLDVDNALTVEPILYTYSRKLGVFSKYRPLDVKYHRDDTSPPEFNREFVAMFRGAKFTEQQSTAWFSEVALHSQAEALLEMRGVDVYLVSNGPSFYIEQLAKRHGIRLDRVHCTHYRFEGGHFVGLDRRGKDNATTKADFVRLHSSRYDISIGLGDNPRNDSQFLQHCDVKIIHRSKSQQKISARDLSEFLVCSNLITVSSLVHSVIRSNPSPPIDGTIRIFIAGAGSHTEVMGQLAGVLRSRRTLDGRPIEVTEWTDAIPISKSLLDLPAIIGDQHDYCVAILTPDMFIRPSADSARKSRKSGEFLPRENVILEMGMSAAVHGWSRTFFIKCTQNGKSARIPSDAHSLIYGVLELSKDGRASSRRKIDLVAEKIVSAIGQRQ